MFAGVIKKSFKQYKTPCFKLDKLTTYRFYNEICIMERLSLSMVYTRLRLNNLFCNIEDTSIGYIYVTH